MIAWNCRSRSRGLSAHDRLESVLTIAWITQLTKEIAPLMERERAFEKHLGIQQKIAA
jgi:hypothetical protein